MSVEDTIKERQSTHGNYKEQCLITRNIKDSTNTVSFRCQLTPYQKEALDMIAVKIGRILAGNANEPDHWHDIAGYATLVEKECLKLKESQTK